MLFAEKTINPIELIMKRGERIKKSKYEKFNFDSELLDRLKVEEAELKTEIENLEASI